MSEKALRRGIVASKLDRVARRSRHRQKHIATTTSDYYQHDQQTAKNAVASGGEKWPRSSKLNLH